MGEWETNCLDTLEGEWSSLKYLQMRKENNDFVSLVTAGSDGAVPGASHKTVQLTVIGRKPHTVAESFPQSACVEAVCTA